MKAINNRDYSTLIAAATQKIPCDLTVKNVKLVNVLTGEIYPASVDVKDGVIVHVQPGEACDSQSKTTVDGQGKYLLPGFVEIHMHVESSMLTPERFGREAVLHGTTSAMTDPHEIGNVCGMEGILPSCGTLRRSMAAATCGTFSPLCCRFPRRLSPSSPCGRRWGIGTAISTP